MKLKVYSLPGCPYCRRVERLIKNMDLKAEIIKVKTIKDKEEIKKKLRKNTFPQVYIVKGTANSRDVHIGGCDDFENYLNFAYLIEEKEINLNKLKEFMKLME